MRFLKKITDYIFFTRPILFFPAWTSFLIFIIINDFVIKETHEILSIMAIMALTMASGFIINQIYDIESDKINEKCFYLYNNVISVKEAKLFAIILFLISLFWSFKYSGFLIAINIGSFILGLIYSLKPFGLKDRPIANITTQTFMGIFATSYAVTDLAKQWDILILYNLINTVLCILTTIPDIKGDIKVKKVTIAVRLGEFKSSILAFSILLFGFCISFLSNTNTILLSIYVIFIMTFILYFLNKKFKIEYLIKINLLLQALIVSYFYYFYLIFIIMMYFLGRLYFKKRFNVKYPQLFEE